MNALNSKGIVLVLAIFACMLLMIGSTAYAAKAGKVRVGTPDLLGPGGDGNFSLTAQIDDAGNVSGEWQDAFTQNPGFHIKVTCLTIVGNTAWVGGVIDQASSPSLIGVQARTMVVDDGPNGDTISFSFIYPNGGAPDCSAQPAFPQTAVPGQVSIK